MDARDRWVYEMLGRASALLKAFEDGQANAVTRQAYARWMSEYDRFVLNQDHE